MVLLPSAESTLLIVILFLLMNLSMDASRLMLSLLFMDDKLSSQ